MGIAWSIVDGVGRPQMGDDPSKNQPILLIAPGMGAGITDCYTRRIFWHAQRNGYKCGIILFRNTKGSPITSNKLNYGGAWPDLKLIMEYVYEKYLLIDKKTGKKRTRLYI